MASYKTITIGLFGSVMLLASPHSFAEDKALLLEQQAQAAYQQGDYAKATALEEQVLVLMRQQYGDKNPDTLITMNNLAEIYRALGNYKAAEPLLKQTLQLRTEILGEKNPDTLMTINSLAGLYHEQGRYELARPLFEKSLQLNQQLLGEKHPNTLSNMNNLATLYEAQGDFSKAEPLLVKVLQLRTALFGEKNPSTLISISNLAALYREQGRYELAELLLVKSLALRTTLLGEKHPDTLVSLSNLAGLYSDQGRYELAEPLYKKAWQLSIETLGEKHPDTLARMSNLATLYHAQGNYDLAEPLFIKTVQLCKEILGETHPNTLISMNNLALIYKIQGRYELAQPLFEQAFQLNKETLGENHPTTLISLNNLAALYEAQGRYDLAQPLYEQVLQLSKKTLGSAHPDTLVRIGNLATLYEFQHNYKLAEPLYIEALQLNKKVLGEKHPQTLLSMNNLGWFYFTQHQYKKAEPLLTKASQLNQTLFGAKNPNSLMMRANLAELYQATGQWDKAAKLWHENLRSTNQFLNQVLWGAGEKTRLAYLQQQEDYKNNYLTFYSVRNTPEMAKEAFYFSLSRKGQLLQIASEVNALAKNSQQPETKALAEKFSAKKQQLANLTLSGKADKEQIQSLEEEINGLEMQLSQKVSAFRRTRQEISPEQVLAKLSDQQVLIDFLLFKQVDFKTQTYTSGQLIALVADKKRGVKLIKLGDIQPITEAVKTYRQHILPNAQGQLAHREDILKPASQKLYQLLWQPLVPYLADKKEVFLIPDGILHLLPFKALMDKQGHYLGESKQITLLSSARDIVLPPVTGKTNDSIIFAAPAFGAQEDKATQTPNRSVATRLQDIYFAPLEGAALEGKALNDLIKTKQPVQFFQDSQASEITVETLKSPRLLHFATHGFFLENQPKTSATPERAGFIPDSSKKLSAQSENPLTRSGLALSGANLGIKGQKQAGGTDGILTALEVLALNLEGTDLVTLSACETGVGDIQVGEGVYSLNRAFQEAGAKAVLSTLWSVADEQTNLFMQHFYGLILNGVSPQQALQQTQLKFIHDKTIQDPFFWAAFTVVGNN